MVNSIEILKTIPYSEFHMWDVKRYNYVFNNSFENAVSLRDILIPFKQSVSKDELIKNNWSIIKKINFQGELFLRNISEISSYKGNVNKVPENSIIYSKINVRHGCVYYHEKGQTPFTVSSEYPTFTFDEKRVDGYYLKRVLRSNEFKKLLNTKTSGISKARVKVDEFLDIQIPLPAFDEQKRIVNNYKSKIEFSKEQEEKSIQLETSLNNVVDKFLGISIVSNIKNSDTRLNFVSYKEIIKWGVDAQSITNVKYVKDYTVLKVSEISNVGSGGTPSRSRKEFYNGKIPWIKTGEVVNDIIYDTDEKITQEAIKNSSAKLYEKGSLIIAMYGQGKTRGRTAKLGVNATTNQACAVLYNINNSKLLTDFLWLYLMNEYERLRELASGNNQPNLNAQMIKNYPVVIPPKEIQQNIINKVFYIKQQIKDLQTQAKENREKAIQEFEEEIFN